MVEPGNFNDFDEIAVTEIIFKNITKSFETKDVLQNIKLEIQGNQVYCLLGRNGAGKSTLINIACNLIKPDLGSVYFDGLSYQTNPTMIYKNLGIQSQFNTLIEELNTFDFLSFTGQMYGLNDSDIVSQSDLLLAYLFDKKDDLHNPIKSYSTGMKKKVNLCAAFLHKPKYLFLDEPFANIDPIYANALCKLINAYKSVERCIVVSSHDLLYVNKIATHIGILENGAFVFNDEINNLTDKGLIDEGLLHYFDVKDFKEDLLTEIVK